MKIEINDNTNYMTIDEVIEALRNGGSLQYLTDIEEDEGESIVDTSLECGSDLEITIATPNGNTYSRTIDIGTLREEFSEGCSFCVWAQNEDNEDILVCFD